MGLGYEAKPITKKRRVVNGSKIITPPSPAGISIPVGWVLTAQGKYIREKDYVEAHGLSFLLNRVSR